MLTLCRPDGIGTVLLKEKLQFDEIKERLRILLENQITHFRCIFQINIHVVGLALSVFSQK
jgi:hypothetical protein